MLLLTREIRGVIRSLLKTPSFTIPSILTLALGTGASIAMFSVLDAIVLRPLPYRDAGNIVLLQYAGHGSSAQARIDRLALEAHSYSTLAGYTGWGYTLTETTPAANLSGARVSPSLFGLLGVVPARGRVFTEEEARRGDGAVTVLSDELWRTRFGGDPNILNHSIVLNGRGHLVIGIMPRGFAFPTRTTQLWTPGPMNPANADDYNASMLTMVGRLAPTATLASASAELRLFRQRVRRDAGVVEPFDPNETRVISLAESIAGSQRSPMFLLTGVVAAVLLIACANVANLMLLRGVVRQQELAVRVALGASRASLLRNAALEAMVVATAGGMAGVGVAVITQRGLAGLLAEDAPRLRDVGLSGSLIGVALLVSLGSAMLVGLAPALHAWRSNAQSALRNGARGSRSSSLRSVLVASELALALALAIGAGLLLKNLRALENVDPGFQGARVLSMRVTPPSAQYADTARLHTLWTQIFSGIAALPGVASVGAIHLTPMGGNNWNPDLRIEGLATPKPGESRSVDWRVVTPSYFQVMGIPVRAGREFTPDDRSGTPLVGIVNEASAKRFFGTANPIGKRVSTVFEPKDSLVTIVGVVGDVRGHGLDSPPEPELYRPLAQHSLPEMTLMVRGRSDPSLLRQSVQGTVTGIDRNVIVDEVQVMSEVARRSVTRSRHTSMLLLGFGLLALALGAIGVFSVMSFAVTQQSREIGIRLALGATRDAIIFQVLRQSAGLVAAGVGAGLVLSLWWSDLVRSQLSLVPASDPETYLLSVIVLVVVAFIGCYLPARRASRIDPAIALRSE